MSKEKVESQTMDKRKAKTEIKEEEEKEDELQLKEKDSGKQRGKDKSELKKNTKDKTEVKETKSRESFKTMLRHIEIKDQMEQQEFHITALKLLKVQHSEITDRK